MLIDTLKDVLEIAQIVDKLTIGPRKILGLPIPEILEGAKANVCVFDTDSAWTYTEETIVSTSHNTPYLHRRFQTRVVASIIDDHLYLTNL